MIINDQYINSLLEASKGVSEEEIGRILDKAEKYEGLSHEEVAALLVTGEGEHIKRIFNIAGKIKENIYGNRVVVFAPLYVSDYCVNKCKYCGYKCDQDFTRRRLTMDEIREEVAILEKMGHKRLALEAGEDPVNCDIDYILECIKTIYDMKLGNGEIRRVNVNIAATTVEEYRKLKEIGIGTYILFQETYHKETYEEVHPVGPKHNYDYHLTAFDRAMEAGIEDVGGGVLVGLYEPCYEVLSLMLHNEYLEEKYGVGFHTISVPRLKPAAGSPLTEYKHLVDDETFRKMVAIIRLAVPYTGMIISTREDEKMRRELIKMGVSQVSAGSNVEVGGYSASEHDNNNKQFELTDSRSAMEILSWLIEDDLVPSFCTACYRKGRTGDRFMSLAKSGNIKNVCHPNALMTLCEYMVDFGSDEFKEQADTLIQREIPKIENEKVRKLVEENIKKIKAGERDLYI
ncbi:MAG TPA: [FeFe] hydrogenase H-cluster radical SAM maturase HydG [Epulopiscium sp.]|nr:[FeFe] hydrogenase H-cluster radical SAM maturase HydG [Candidatus Epulonipiscium sp.]